MQTAALSAARPHAANRRAVAKPQAYTDRRQFERVKSAEGATFVPVEPGPDSLIGGGPLRRPAARIISLHRWRARHKGAQCEGRWSPSIRDNRGLTRKSQTLEKPDACRAAGLLGITPFHWTPGLGRRFDPIEEGCQIGSAREPYWSTRFESTILHSVAGHCLRLFPQLDSRLCRARSSHFKLLL